MAGYVVGCCNGVVCILKQEVFFLWNPATRNSTKLPKLDLQIPPISKCGFGWDAASGAYKVFVVSSGGFGQIYSSNTNSWRRVCMHGRRLPMKHKNAQFVCGKIHWPTHRHTESFDLNTEVFGEIEHPFDLEFGMQLWLGEIKGCLSLVCDDSDGTTLGVWIMKEYGVKESWLKVLNASLACPQQHNGPFSAVLEIASEGVVLLIYGSAFLVCSRDDVAVLISSPDKVSTCCKVTRRYTTHFYVESLVSPVPDANR
ncbi:F-box/kelch-repeat protein At3g23880-like [Salvia miltiorrhiza]|uniref:F-box/kelch-repeat protein At3g23880-like n=1 Tax=Salvia miltiorrhiza TaxID=226208 RepID=UPI0025AD3451|nr:F-box/kelch-repeat protein At3g23880-like [Salvia miltiorrhiza]